MRWVLDQTQVRAMHVHIACVLLEFDRLCFQLKRKCQPARETILMLAEIVIKRSIGESLLTSMFKFFGITIYDLVHSCSHAFSRAQCALDTGCMNLFQSD